MRQTTVGRLFEDNRDKLRLTHVSGNLDAPIKVTDTTWDTPVLCAVTPTKLWAVEGDFGGTRHLLRFSR